MSTSKPKRNLLTSLNHIERYHRRRMVFVTHATLSLALQFTIWVNWYASYVVRGLGFEGTFFSDRFTISIVLAIFLLGHFLTMRLMESKDQMVIQAIHNYDMDDDAFEPPHYLTDEINDDDDDNYLNDIDFRQYDN